MDVRGRRLRKQSDDVTAFTSSMAFDGQIASAVIKVNMAHMVSLVESGEVDAAVGGKCLGFLTRASPSVSPGTLAEDFHQFLEQQAVDSIGVETAGYLNLGKSRNDQVATAIRMRMRERITDLLSEIAALQRTILEVARKHGAEMVPGYTHLQRAQPVTLAHHYLGYFDAFQRDAQRLFQLYARVNLSPMGSAALGGTSVNIDRDRVAKLLGFEGITGNAMDSVASRDFATEALACAALTMVDVSRLAEEFVLWSSKEFGFVEVSEEYATSSSIMPQKKNPVVAEVARAKFGSVLGALVAALSISKSLPFAYNMDLQEVTPHVWKGLDDTINSVEMIGRVLKTCRFNLKAVADSMREDYSTATALANYLVQKHRLSFRQAHAIVGELVRYSVDEHVPLEAAAAKHMSTVSAKLARRVKIDEATVRKVLDPTNFLTGIRTKGGSNPKFITAEVGARSVLLGKNVSALAGLRSSLKRSESLLAKAVRRMARG
ncbi:MAG: argininosuccinate lyase [Nitrososphaerales archaeon]|nr:argininosuccinate lyase [Nitrososphaerales archaeon]